MLRVNRRDGFSDRQGICVQNREMQLDDFDKRTRIQIFNLISKIYGEIYEGESRWGDNIQSFFRYVYDEIFCQPVDVRELNDDDKFFAQIREVILNATYDEILTFIEAVAEYWDEETSRNVYSYYSTKGALNVYNIFNELFKKEYVGYRFIDYRISPISNEIEVNTINETLYNNNIVSEHISKAHNLLADRENPDYENSIKESISAVEAICEIITGIRGKDATLGNMLKKLEDKGIIIHAALKSAFNILYGYTSDANGIRHAGDIGGEASTFEEAKFMLVSCCAFINYLKGIMAD